MKGVFQFRPMWKRDRYAYKFTIYEKRNLSGSLYNALTSVCYLIYEGEFE